MLAAVAVGLGVLTTVVGGTVVAPAVSATPSPLPIDATRSMAAGYMFNCGIQTGGTVKCWGGNVNGELGAGPSVPWVSATPVTVSGISDAVAVTAGNQFACALTSGGGVKCWGNNTGGQLGNNTTTKSLVPVTPTGLSSGVRTIDAGPGEVCAVKVDGTLWCWGATSTLPVSKVPVQVSGVTDATSVSVDAAMACFTTPSGPKCFGLGYLGDTTGTSVSTSATPVAVLGMGAVRQIGVGYQGNCVLTLAGGVKCWGHRDTNGTGTTTTNVPQDLAGLTSGVRSIAVHDFVGCAIRVDGSLWCWGLPRGATYGDPAPVTVKTPVQVSAPGAAVVAIDMSWGHMCAITVDGLGRCWGDPKVMYGPEWAPLGHGQGSTKTALTIVPGYESGVTTAAVGGDHTCGGTAAGVVTCLGDNLYGQLGPSSPPVRSTTPVSVPGLTATAIDAGTSHTCAITDVGAVKCWGRNNNGQLGNGTKVNSATPVAVTGLTSGVVKLDVGGDTSCAVKSPNNDLYCWGEGSNGQLGNGASIDATTPVLSGTTGVTAVAIEANHGCAIVTGGTAKCWGANGSGQLGNGTTTASNTPVTVTGSFGPAISTGPTFSCATAGTSVKCWGANNAYQLGLSPGTVTSSSTPVTTTTGTVAFSQLASEDNNSCALDVNGAVRCWGFSVWRQSLDFPSTVVASGYTSIAAPGGPATMCGITTAAALSCWGRSADGQQGGDVTGPVSVIGGDQFAHDFGTDPTILASRTPAPNADGWTKTPVSVSYTCDGGSAPLVCPSTQVIGEGVDQTTSGTVTDSIGRQATATVTGISVDLTAPTGTGTPQGTPLNGWYRDDVAIEWSCSDALSGIATCPAAGTVTGEGPSVATTGVVTDRAGNAATVGSTPVSIDRTPPVTSPSAIPTWSRDVVTVDLTASDNLSGVASTTYALDGGDETTGTQVTIVGDGIHHLVVRSTDVAGNVEAAHTIDVGIDATGPTITASVDPAPNEVGWNRTDVVVTFTCTDAISGVASCTGPTPVTSEGTTVVDGTGTDNAGGQSWTSAVVNIDRTPPTISAGVPAAPPSGWFQAPVTVNFTCADARSGIATCAEPMTLVDDGTGSGEGTASDLAGNTASTSFGGVQIDATGPTVTATVTPPFDGSTPIQGPATVHFTCSDATSGVATCPDDVVVTAPGTTVVTGAGTDVAGNSTTTSIPVAIAATPVTVTSSANPAVAGQTVTLRGQTSLSTTGTMTFYDGTTLLATVGMTGGGATFTTKLAVGTHSITVRYKKASTKPEVVSDPLQQVVERGQTTTEVTASADPAPFGASVVLQATVRSVAPAAAVSSGSVRFLDGTTVLGTASVSSTGVATLSVKASSVGTHPITAAYLDAPKHTGSASPVLELDVVAASTSVAVTSSFPTTTVGHSGTIKATVTSVPPGSGTPTGIVEFYDDNRLIAVVTLLDGKATIPIASLAAGTHPIVAVYRGSANHASSSSSTFTQTLT